MKVPSIPQNYSKRVAVLHELMIRDTVLEERFDVITAYSQSLFSAQVAVASLVDADRQCKD